MFSFAKLFCSKTCCATNYLHNCVTVIHGETDESYQEIIDMIHFFAISLKEYYNKHAIIAIGCNVFNTINPHSIE